MRVAVDATTIQWRMRGRVANVFRGVCFGRTKYSAFAKLGANACNLDRLTTAAVPDLSYRSLSVHGLGAQTLRTGCCALTCERDPVPEAALKGQTSTPTTSEFKWWIIDDMTPLR